MQSEPDTEIQRMLLGKVPKAEGVDVAVAWRPFGKVSGDFYNFMEIEEDSIGVIVGDVSGKGADAALLMAYTLGHIRVGLKEHLRLPYIMADLDEDLKQHSMANKFVEVLLGIYFLPLRRFVFVHGGGIAPVVFRHAEGTLLFSRGRYPAVGFPFARGRTQRFVEDGVDLERGDVMLVFSDGISERVDRDGEEIVRKSSLAEVKQAPSLKAILGRGQEGAEAIVSDIFEYLDGLDSPRTDDETLIVLKAT